MSVRIAVNENVATDFAMTNESVLTKDNFEELQQKQLMPRCFSAPLYVMWEITSRCPLRCKHCYNESAGKTTDVSHERAMKIAEEIVELKVYSTCLTGGEPCLRSDFFQIASYLKENGAAAGTITSGWPINERTAELYARCFDSVQVSLDGPNAEVHDAMRGRAGSFDRAVNAISLFRKKGIRHIGVAFSITKLNVETFPEVVELCTRLGVSELRTQPIMLAGRAAKEAVDVPEERYRKVKDYIVEYNARSGDARPRLEWGEPLPHIIFGARAKFAIFLRITAEGDYSISPYLPFTFGNAAQYSIKEVWAKGMRRGWEMPTIQDSVKRVASIADIKSIVEEYNFAAHDVLGAES